MSTDNVAPSEIDYTKEDAEFRVIETERFMYNADKCKATPLVGYLLNMLPMPPLKSGVDPKTREPIMRNWFAFLIKVTRPVLAVNRDKVVEEVPAGSEVLIPATYELQQFITKAATAEGVVFEVRIEPKKKIPIGTSGQQMWLYSLAAKPMPKPRQTFGLTAVLAPHQLPAVGASPMTDAEPLGEDGTIPF